MKEAVFNALPVYTLQSQIDSAPVGTYFLSDVPVTGGSYGTVQTGESAQQNNTALRHKITYHQKVASDGSLAGAGSLTKRRVFDILESDDNADETKTGTRPGLDRLPARDDDDRKFYRETDWS